MPANLTHRPEWKALTAHYAKNASLPLRDILLQDKDRFTRFSVQENGFLFDYTRHPVTAETIQLLTTLAHASGIEGWRERLFAGDTVNTTENRPALHTALRADGETAVLLDGVDILPAMALTRTRMKDIATRLRAGTWTGETGQPIRNIIHIGIGGSDLGPRMACAALQGSAPINPTLYFVSNVDASQLDAALTRCTPDNTLIIIASKTFTTAETMMNARSALSWLFKSLPASAAARHIIGITSNTDAARGFGIVDDNILPMADGVGGRYSLWSAIGLAIAIAAGPAVFDTLLDGARAMDHHFRTAPLDRNIPVLMALLSIWQRNFAGAAAQAIIPYDARLRFLPAYLQQLDMESNGKTADTTGHIITDYKTAPAVFGAAGTDAQHSFFQWLHQGSDAVPIDLIAACRPDHAHAGHHNVLLANMAAQAQALSHGRTATEAHRHFGGGRAVSCILIDRLDGYHLGQLIAAYEHKIFVQGIIWGINSFDQFGVELGKDIANNIAQNKTGTLDPATQALLAYIAGRDEATA